MRIHLARKHPLELETLDVAFDPADVRFDRSRGCRIAFRFGELEQFARLGQTGAQPIERADDGLEPGPLPTEFLRAIGLAPDRGILELAQDLREPLVAPVVVKGTS